MTHATAPTQSAPEPSAPPELAACRAAAFAMGARFEIVLPGPPTPHARAACEAALAEIRCWHDRLNAFDPASALSRLNREGVARPARADAETFALIERCVRAHAATAGAFDPALGRRMRDAGFRDAPSRPDPSASPGGPSITLDPVARTVRLAPGCALDLGAIAKGFALDRAAEVLRDAGVRSALLQGGTSSVVAIGTPPDADAWTIALAGSAFIARLRDSALSVSAPSGRTAPDPSGVDRGHILDPRTGRSAGGVRLAAVVSQDRADAAASAEIWSTALVVLGHRPPSMPESMHALIEPEPDGPGDHDPVSPEHRVWPTGPTPHAFVRRRGDRPEEPAR